MTSWLKVYTTWNKAEQDAFWTKLLATLKPGAQTLLSFEDIHQQLNVEGMTYRGLQTVPVDQITGRVGRAADFTQEFLPKAARRETDQQTRWAQIANNLSDSAAGLPRVELYKVGPNYFVKEGQERVRLAQELGHSTLEADVWEMQPPDSAALQQDLLEIERAHFLAQTGLDGQRPDHDIDVTLNGGYAVLLQQITTHQATLTEAAGQPITLEAAAADWYDTIYQPTVQAIIRARVQQRQPDRTLTDLYVWALQYAVDLTMPPPESPPEAAPSTDSDRRNLLNMAAQWLKSHIGFGMEAIGPPLSFPAPGNVGADDADEAPAFDLEELPPAPAPPQRRREEEEEAAEPPPSPPAPAPAQEPAPTDKEASALPTETEEPEPEPTRSAQPPEEAAEATPAEAIQFAAHYPREVKPALGNWQPLLGYLFKASAADAVDADAQAQLGPRTDIRTVERPAQAPVPEGALVTATPHVPGLDFNPPTLSTYFLKDWHRFAFEFRANGGPLDQSANGNLTFMVDGVIVGDVPLSIYVSEDVSAPEPQTSEAKPYRAVFCSYSHRDTHIVKMVEAAIHTLGYAYLRDATTLRSGEDWNAAIMAMIEQADIFQLFWSENAAESDYVAEEWRYALDLMAAETKDDHFIRPVCWVDPIAPKPPADLGHIHFVHEPVLAAWLGDAAVLNDPAAPDGDAASD